MKKVFKMSWHKWVGIVLLCFLFGSCKTTKTTISDKAPIAVISINTAIEQLIRAENSGDFEALNQLYADDFKSLSPVYQGTKSALLAIMKESYKTSPTEVKAKILETNTGTKVATANLFWSIYDTKGTLLYARPLLQIWVFRNNHWQLQRTLFYQTEEVPAFDD